MKKNILPYNPELKKLARQLRQSSTLSEVLLWRHLKGKQLMGYDFDRQKPIDNFIVDFFCSELMLAIEIDGDTHNYKVSQDIDRQKRLESLGVRFLRFTDEEVKLNIAGVVAVIEKWIKERQPTPTPLPRGDYDSRDSAPSGDSPNLIPLRGGDHVGHASSQLPAEPL